MSTNSTRKPRTWLLLPIALLILSLLLGATLGLGQGGTGRENTNTNSNKKAPATKRTTPPRKTPKTTRSTAPANNDKPKTDESAADERTYWESIRLSTDPEDFKAYLEKYPNGQFAVLARNILRRLEAARTVDSGPPKATPRPEPVVPTKIELVYVSAGSFMMGSNNGGADEKPVHQVTIKKGFYMGRYEVTQAEWQQVMGSNPSYFQGDNLPVEQVSWDDAQSFISKLNERGDGFKYRLPTEAEWEYACRAGTTTDFAFGNALSSEQANFNGTYPYGGATLGVYRERTTAVGSFAPNAFGLNDMHGNVWEWCEDWHHASYEGAPNDGSARLSGGEQKYRVLRGGSWSDDAFGLRSAFRYWLFVVGRYDSFGFRVVAVKRSE